MELKDSFVGRVYGVNYFRTHKTEAYVEIPPALLITDERGDAWSLGSEFVGTGYNLEFNVVRNDVSTDEFAKKIVYRGGKVRIYGQAGWRVWNGRTFI